MMFGSFRRSIDFWPVLLALLAAVLIPTAGVLWFMNEAVVNQRNLSRQRLAEAYRGHLTLARERVEALWEKRAADLGREAGAASAAAEFARIVRSGLADSAVILDARGAVVYPAPLTPPEVDALEWDANWLAARRLESAGKNLEATEAFAKIGTARAVQAQVRCLLRAGRTARAAQIATERFHAGPWLHQADPNGRLIAIDELLLAARLKSAPAKTALIALLNDYDAPIQAAQRLFAMNEVKALDSAAVFPTLAAEALASRFAEKYRAAPPEGSLQHSGLADVWTLSAPGGRAVALYTTATVKSLLPSEPPEQEWRFAVLPPAVVSTGFDQALPAGGYLPGWQVALSVVGAPADDFARKQTLAYLWIGILATALAALAGVYAAQALNRQWRVARLKTDLVAAVSHELKTPLAGMRVLVETLLEDDIFEQNKTREYLEMISRENLRLSRLIENFLTFSRLERNRQKFEFQTTPPERVAHAAMEAVRERFPLEVEIAPGLPPVRADGDAMTTVLLNLLDNAYKYSPGEKRIKLRVYNSRGRVTFAVEDRGIGIAPGERKKIFRRFYQVDRRLSRDVGGVGLGLSIVEFIVRAHGGSVDVESQPGAGSTFLVSLPGRAAA